MTKDPKELAREVSRVKGRHGTSHKILFKKSHINVPQTDPGMYEHHSFKVLKICNPP